MTMSFSFNEAGSVRSRKHPADGPNGESFDRLQ